jgi:hypothetical protein
MEHEPAKTFGDKLKGAIRDLVGLPPGDGTPHGEGRPVDPAESPRGTLTAPDAEGLPTPAGTGIQVER